MPPTDCKSKTSPEYLMGCCGHAFVWADGEPSRDRRPRLPTAEEHRELQNRCFHGVVGLRCTDVLGGPTVAMRWTDICALDTAVGIAPLALHPEEAEAANGATGSTGRGQIAPGIAWVARYGRPTGGRWARLRP